MLTDREALVHFVGGAVGGTTGTCITCPLEVVKTRMQSSQGITPLGPSTSQENSQRMATEFAGSLAAKSDISRNRVSFNFSRFLQSQTRDQFNTPKKRLNILRYFSYIVKTEGFGALYKGLLPNLVGVAPSKAVYFYSYSTSKRIWNESGIFVANSAIVHMVSAGSAEKRFPAELGVRANIVHVVIMPCCYPGVEAIETQGKVSVPSSGFVAASAVNPIWLVKTRLQLHHGKSGILEMIRRVYKREGIKGFYKGVTASYAGVSETVIQFVIYEHLRSVLVRHHKLSDDRVKVDFLNFMVAGGFAKFFACVITYPHEVVRTRLREESAVKRGFFRTLYDLYKEGGRSMYRGLSVQLMRTVPNTAITMGTYEVVVYMLH